MTTIFTCSISKFSNLLIKIFAIYVFSIANSTQARNFYFSESQGDDSRTMIQAQNSSTPWKSISKLNSFFANLLPGDSVLFKRSESFYGTITVNKSGTSTLPIVICAYDIGVKPIINGFITLSSWTNEGNGIYSQAVVCESKPNLITINGKPYGMGRYPNVGSNLIYESCNTNISITDYQLTNSPNWAGAEAVIRKTESIMDRCLITNHSNQTLTYSSLGTTVNATIGGYYYFIQNDLKTLDVFGEWYYDGIRVYVFFGINNPINYSIKIPTLSQLLLANSKAYVTISDLSFEGTCSGKDHEGGGVEPGVIFIDGSSSYFTIKNCSLDFCGANGITLQSHHSNIDNNSINNITRIGIEGLKGFITVTNNYIKNSGIIQGSSYAATRTGGIWNWDSNCLYQYNTIDSVAKTAVAFWGNNVTIKNNFITHFNIVMNDGGGIYTDNSTNTGRIIDGNIVLYGIGNKGKPTYSFLTNGIYLDSYSSNVTAINNTVAFLSHSGFFLSNNASNVIQNNTTYDNARGIYFLEWSVANSVMNNVIKNNIFFAKNPSDLTLQFQSNNGTIGTFGISDSNYFARPISDNTVISTYEAPLNNNQWQNRTLENWQAYTGQDVHSQKSPITISNTNDILFEYNPTQTNKVILLNATYIGVDSTIYTNSITLAPFTSIVLIKLPNSTMNQQPIIQNQIFSVIENSPNGTNVGTVVASDPDAGQTLTYSILSGNTSGAFAINASTGVLTVANSSALNFETTPSFSLVVKVQDNGTGTLSSQATVTVSLTNINEVPIISNQAFSVAENSSNGTNVGTVVASDPDAGQTLTYSILSGNTSGAFAINASTGVLTVANSSALNFEVTPSFALVVKVQDNGTGTLSSQATVTVSLTNINEVPVISNQAFSVAENSANGTNVGTVVASDPDAGQTLTYSILSGNTSGAFAINASTGVLTVANSSALNFEVLLHLHLVVKVQDNGTGT
jgi:hypothetical protein